MGKPCRRHETANISSMATTTARAVTTTAARLDNSLTLACRGWGGRLGVRVVLRIAKGHSLPAIAGKGSFPEKGRRARAEGPRRGELRLSFVSPRAARGGAVFHPGGAATNPQEVRWAPGPRVATGEG